MAFTELKELSSHPKPEMATLEKVHPFLGKYLVTAYMSLSVFQCSRSTVPCPAAATPPQSLGSTDFSKFNQTKKKEKQQFSNGNGGQNNMHYLNTGQYKASLK